MEKDENQTKLESKAAELFPGRMRGIASYDAYDSVDFSIAK